ncbi:MAG: hypothetical protein R3Y46_07350, partial [Opitutales bacterium]
MKTYTNYIKAGLSFALLSFFAPSIYAEEDTTTTLSVNKYSYIDGVLTATATPVTISSIVGDSDGISDSVVYYATWSNVSNSYVLNTDVPTDGTDYFTVTYNGVGAESLTADSSTSTSGVFVNNSKTAIYSSTTSTADVTGDFIANGTTRIGGGAVQVYTSTFGTLSGSFIGNSSTSWTSSNAGNKGGAVYVRTNAAVNASISSISGDFIANYASTGGAIGLYSTASGTVSIDTIEGDFIANYATQLDSDSNYFNTAQGGAIWLSTELATSVYINSITGDFLGNYVTSTDTAQGGAIAIASTSTSYVYIGGYDETDGYYGMEGNIMSNYAVSSGTAQGGAIYNNAGSITFTATDNDDATGNDYLYMGNWAGASEDSLSSADDANGGFLYQDSGATTFYTDASSSITIGDTSLTGYDSIAGEGSIEKTGDGTLIINSSMAYYSGSMTVSGGTFKFSNVMNSSSSISVDASGTLSIVINSSNYGETILGTLSGDGSVLISFDTASLADIADLTYSTTSIYDSSTLSNSIAWDSSLTTNADGNATLSVDDVDYIVTISDDGYITFAIDTDDESGNSG